MESVIKKLKICSKDEGNILSLLKEVQKSYSLAELRNKINKINFDYLFCDKEEIINNDLETDYTLEEIIIDDKIYIKKKNENLNQENSNESTEIEENLSNHEIKNEKNKENNNEIKTNKELFNFIEKLIPDSKEEIKNNIYKKFEDNGIETINDILCLKEEDINSFEFPIIFKRKLLDELNKLKPKTELSDTTKCIIKSLFEKDTSIEDILFTLNINNNTKESDLVKQYIQSLQKPKKPIPQHLKKLFVKTSGESLPCYKYPSNQIIGKKYYTLLVMGETGSGKTTLLDAFVNYLAGINYEDEWRYKLVDENHIAKKESGESQTSEITSYYVNYHRLDDNDGKEINIKIIDTPGLGDTKGILKDNEIIKQFEKLFNEIGELDYILVTVKSNTTRFTQANQYIYDRIQEVFGKDAIERFILMCTFSDGQRPLALDVLKGKLIYQDFFCFNNSALYVPAKHAGQNSKFFWKLGISNVRRFFDVILTKNLLPLSLKMSKQVMEHREWLFASVQSSKDRINEGFKLLEKSNKLLQEIKKNEKQLNENGSFTYECDEEKTRDVPLPKPYQYCGNCGCLCCQICVWPEGAEFSQCSYFNGGRPCPKCPGRCGRAAHLRATSVKEKYTVRVTKIYQTKKNLYEESKKGLSISEVALQEEIEKMSNLGKSILSDMQMIKNSLIELDKIALKPRVLTNVEYFKQMIDNEKNEKNPGWEERVKGLESMLEQAKQINDISNAQDITNLFPQYNNILNELKSKKTRNDKSSCSIF